MTKLTEILKSKNVSFEKLSAKTGISAERIAALSETGEPTLGEMRRLADALKVSISVFAATNSPAEHQTDLLFRRASIGDSVPSITVDGLSRKVASSFGLLRSNAQQNEKHSPWWFSHFEHGQDSFESAERNALIFRKLFCFDDQLSPILSLPKVVVEKMGLMLFVIQSSDIDGASAYFEGIPFAFISARFSGRMLFTLAHECGHLTSHHDPAESFAIIDEDLDSVAAAKSAQSSEEFYANAFASALLMPSKSVGLAMKKIRQIAKLSSDEIGDLEICYLARIFGVSFWAAARRCEDLSLIPRGGAASLYEKVCEEYQSPEKRADLAGLPPRPVVDFPAVPRSLIASAVNRIHEGELSIGSAASALGLSIADLVTANRPTSH